MNKIGNKTTKPRQVRLTSVAVETTMRSDFVVELNVTVNNTKLLSAA